MGDCGELFALWFVVPFRHEGEQHTPDDEDDTELFIGFYRSQADAIAASERLRERPGFCDHPQGFQCDPVVLNRFSGAEGFVSYSRASPDETLAERYADGSSIAPGGASWGAPTGPVDNHIRDETAPSSMDDLDAVHALWFHRVYEERTDTLLSIGVFTSIAAAQAAIEKIGSAPGFRVYPEGFKLIRHVIGATGWANGYLSRKEAGDDRFSPEWTTQPCDPRIDGRFG